MIKPTSRLNTTTYSINDLKSVIEILDTLKQNPNYPNSGVLFSLIFDFFEKDNTVSEKIRKEIADIISNSEAWTLLKRNQEIDQRLSALREWHKNYLEDKKFAQKYVLPDVPTDLERKIAKLEHKLKILNGGWTVLYNSPWYKKLNETDKAIVKDCFASCNPNHDINNLKQQLGKGRRRTRRRTRCKSRRRTSSSQRCYTKTLKRTSYKIVSNKRKKRSRFYK